MRIRKRFPPSSLSSLPLSDPQLHRSPVVQQHIQGSIQVYPDGNLCTQQGNTNSQPSDPPNQPLPPPSDHQPMIGSEQTRWVWSDTIKAQELKQKDLEGEEVKEERWRDEEKTNDIRKGSILGAEVGTEVLSSSASSHQEVERWCEGDKVFPLKKRRGSFERRVSEDTITAEKAKKMKAKMKSKTNKKCVQQQQQQQNGGDDGNEQQEVRESSSTGAKKMKRGSVIMEGSRCSRVNGRGWRCCQQTLVGYSLCEHHLGKGRLRSMTSVRSRAGPNKDDQRLLSVQEHLPEKKLLGDNGDDDDDDDDEDEKKPLMVTKKRMKLGMVKARSISSLLGQPNNAVVVIADSNNKNGSL
uniref:WRC domain-containing protein n=1 Tax=Davidia involucrata TaxID=16924 RepID=A0A5B7AL51_DAVIN